MTREEAIKWLIKPARTSTDIGEIKAKEIEAYNVAIEALSADAVSVVRCGECKLGGTEDCPMDEIDDEYFCNFGERREP